MQVTEILRLKEMGYFTYREIADSVGCSKTTVGDVLTRCKACGLTYDDAANMTPERINELIYPDSFRTGNMYLSRGFGPQERPPTPS